jgi:hypothetical protein
VFFHLIFESLRRNREYNEKGESSEEYKFILTGAAARHAMLTNLFSKLKTTVDLQTYATYLDIWKIELPRTEFQYANIR